MTAAALEHFKKHKARRKSAREVSAFPQATQLCLPLEDVQVCFTTYLSCTGRASETRPTHTCTLRRGCIKRNPQPIAVQMDGG